MASDIANQGRKYFQETTKKFTVSRRKLGDGVYGFWKVKRK